MVLSKYSHPSLLSPDTAQAKVVGMSTDLKMAGNNSYSIALLVFFPAYMAYVCPRRPLATQLTPTALSSLETWHSSSSALLGPLPS